METSKGAVGSVAGGSTTGEPMTIGVEVVFALPERCWRVALRLPVGATVADALSAADLPSRIPGGLDLAELGLGMHGHALTTTAVLADGDRVELLRPLVADPKEARRRRSAGRG